MKSGNLNFPEPSGPLQACNGTALPLPLPLWFYSVVLLCGVNLVLFLYRFPVVSRDVFRGTPDRTMCPEVDSASESEYQGFLLG